MLREDRRMSGQCVECFKPLPKKAIICEYCQGLLDGWDDHLSSIKDEDLDEN